MRQIENNLWIEDICFELLTFSDDGGAGDWVKARRVCPHVRRRAYLSQSSGPGKASAYKGAISASADDP